jgi:hypothetical protein
VLYLSRRGSAAADFRGYLGERHLRWVLGRWKVTQVRIFLVALARVPCRVASLAAAALDVPVAAALAGAALAGAAAFFVPALVPAEHKRAKKEEKEKETGRDMDQGEGKNTCELTRVQEGEGERAQSE